MIGLFLGLLLIALAVGLGYVTSGWTDLQQRYPDQATAALSTFSFRSAIISNGWKLGFSFGGVIVFQPCEDGLRVGLIAPFSYLRNSFFVPWEEVVFEPVPPLHPLANIVFGKPMVGVARVSPRLARKIAYASQLLINPAP